MTESDFQKFKKVFQPKEENMTDDEKKLKLCQEIQELIAELTEFKAKMRSFDMMLTAFENESPNMGSRRFKSWMKEYRQDAKGLSFERDHLIERYANVMHRMTR